MDRRELVEKMIAANVTYGMDASLSVAIEELLKEPTTEEMTTYWHIDDEHEKWRRNYFYSGKKIIASRRAKLERVKTPEKRVTVGPRMAGEGYEVWLDGKFRFGGYSIARCDAETYRIGLIQQLKEKN